jgi:hypothetical protein
MRDPREGADGRPVPARDGRLNGHMPVARHLLSMKNPRHPSRLGKPACRVFAVLDLAGLARYYPNGDLEVGDAMVSERFLMDRWNWSRSKVRGFLKELERDGTIERFPGRTPRGTGIVRFKRYAQDYMMPGDAEKRTAQGTNHVARPAETLWQNDLSGQESHLEEPPFDPKKEKGLRREHRRDSKTHSVRTEKPVRTDLFYRLMSVFESEGNASPQTLADTACIEGFTPDEAAWTITIADSIDEYVERDDLEDGTSLVANALADMSVKNFRFTRPRFRGFVESRWRLGETDYRPRDWDAFDTAFAICSAEGLPPLTARKHSRGPNEVSVSTVPPALTE